jgi:hypothetical protein
LLIFHPPRISAKYKTKNARSYRVDWPGAASPRSPYLVPRETGRQTKAENVMADLELRELEESRDVCELEALDLPSLP